MLHVVGCSVVGDEDRGVDGETARVPRLDGMPQDLGVRRGPVNREVPHLTDPA